MKRPFLLAVLAAMATGPAAMAQSVWPSTINATGGSATIAGRTYEWSVGEMTLVNTFTTSTIVVTQGLLQPEQSTTGVDNHNIFQYLSVFPNPSSGTVNFTFNSPQQAVMALRLTDMAGKVVQEKSSDIKAGINTGQIDITTLAAATYMLQVTLTSGGTAMGSTAYKIQKLQ